MEAWKVGRFAFHAILECRVYDAYAIQIVGNNDRCSLQDLHHIRLSRKVIIFVLFRGSLF